MALKLLVVPQLDEAATAAATRAAEKAFGGAGQAGGEAMTTALAEHLASARASGQLENSLKYISKHGDQVGKDFAENMASNIRLDLTPHGRAAGETFLSGMQSAMQQYLPGAGAGAQMFGGISSAAEKMGLDVSAGALVAGAGIAAIGAAAIGAGDKLVGLGSKFDDLSNVVAIRTGTMGSDLESLNQSIDDVGSHTASSLDKIADIGARVNQATGLTGKPFEDLTTQIANLDRKVGETTNIRDLNKVIEGFQLPASEMGRTLDGLYDTFTKTGIPVNELIGNLKDFGPVASTLGLSVGELQNYIVSMDKAGLDASSSMRGLNLAATNFAKNGIDLKTGLADTVTQMKAFHDAGNDTAELMLAKDVFGTKGAEQFMKAVNNASLSAASLNHELAPTPGTINDMNDRTKTLAENWTLVGNKIELALKPLADFAYQMTNDTLADLLGSNRPPHSPYGTQVGTPKDAAGNPIPPANTPYSAHLDNTDIGGLLLPPGAAPPPIGAPPRAPGASPFDPSALPLGQLPPGGAPSGPPRTPQDIAADLAKKKGGAGSGPQVPYPADYGQPLGPGQSYEDWQKRQQAIEAQHAVDQTRADVTQLAPDATPDQRIKAQNALQQAQERQLAEQDKPATGAKAQGAQVPYGPGYGAPPRPGETSQTYGAEQSLVEAQHKSATAQAELARVQANSTHTAEVPDQGIQRPDHRPQGRIRRTTAAAGRRHEDDQGARRHSCAARQGFRHLQGPAWRRGKPDAVPRRPGAR